MGMGILRGDNIGIERQYNSRQTFSKLPPRSAVVVYFGRISENPRTVKKLHLRENLTQIIYQPAGRTPGEFAGNGCCFFRVTAGIST